MSNKRNVILFDIDRTLLNTDLFVERLSLTVSKYSKLSVEEVNNKIGEYMESLDLIFYFDFLTFLDKLDLSDEQYGLIKKDYDGNSYIYPKYSDVIPILKHLKKNNYNIGIFSEGTPRFQQIKLKNLNIDKYINPDYVFITQLKRNNGTIKKIPIGCYIVDDNIDVIRYLEKKEKFHPILLNRNNIDEIVKGKFKIIHSLIEIKNILM